MIKYTLQVVTHPAFVFYGGLILASIGASWAYPPAGLILFGATTAIDAVWNPSK